MNQQNNPNINNNLKNLLGQNQNNSNINMTVMSMMNQNQQRQNANPQMNPNIQKWNKN